MAFRYVVKKRMVGIGTKTEKYVAASYSVANIDFDRLCDQVTSQGMVPRGIVKAVLDGMIDALCTYASIGATVRLGDFGSLRPGLNGKSQEDAKSVTADVVYRQKLIFVPGQRLKNMMKQSGITRLVTGTRLLTITCNDLCGTLLTGVFTCVITITISSSQLIHFIVVNPCHDIFFQH